MDQKSQETVFSIANYHQSGDKWQSKILFPTIFLYVRRQYKRFRLPPIRCDYMSSSKLLEYNVVSCWLLTLFYFSFLLLSFFFSFFPFYLSYFLSLFSCLRIVLLIKQLNFQHFFPSYRSFFILIYVSFFVFLSWDCFTTRLVQIRMKLTTID